MRKLPEGSAKAAMLRPTIEREEPVMGKLQDKTALITGASSGIGKKVAISFAEEGADIAINYPDASQAKNAEAVVSEIEKRGRRAIAIKADVSKADENAAMVDSFMEAFSHIDILVNNAGVGRTVTVDEMTVENWDEMIAINLRSVFLTTHKVLPLMYARGHGKIINTASQLAYKGAPGLAHYTASKAAIISFTRSLSLEIADRGVNVNCVAPGATTTPILDGMDEDILEAIRQTIPRGRFAVVDEIAPTYVFLASRDGDHYVGHNGGDIFL